MPTIETREIMASNISVDDVVVDRNGAHRTVAEVKAGPKWTTVRDADGALLGRVGSELVVATIVAVPTAEEAAAAQEANDKAIRTENNRRIGEWVEWQMHDGYRDRLQTNVKKLDASRSNRAIEDIIVATATSRLAAELVMHKSEDVDWVTVHEYWAATAREKLTSSYGLKALSRSTSVVSNLMEDVENELRVKLLNAMAWGFFRF